MLTESESNSKLSNINDDDTRTKVDNNSAECSEPSDCKIPKTDSGDCESKVLETDSEVIDVKVVYNKNKYDVSCPIDTTVADFKKQLQGLLGKIIQYFKHTLSI